MKITFVGQFPIPHDELLQNIAAAKGRGLPYVREAKPHGRRLAVVGGGPSIVRHLHEIRSYTDIWAINGACGFLREHGIESTLFSVDPTELLTERVRGARRAILASRCHLRVFEALKGCDIQLFDILQDAVGERGFWGSVSSVMTVFDLAPYMGYRDADFYGCEGSYSEGTHAYMNDKDISEYAFYVECGGQEYLTGPDLYQQTRELSKLLRFTHDRFKDKSGGLLTAMIAQRMKYEIHESMEIEPDHDITRISTKLKEGLKPMEAVWQ